MEESFDFKPLELLTKAPSKKYLRKFLEYCFLLRTKTSSFETTQQTPVGTQFWQDFGLQEEETHKV